MLLVSRQSDGCEAYLLYFNQLKFLFISSLNLRNLQYFCQSNQVQLGKIDIRFNLEFLRIIPQINNIDFVILTEYRQVLVLPYLLRNQSQNVKILATKSIVQSAKIYALDFHQYIKKIDQITKKLTFQEQSVILDKYQIRFNQNFSNWLPLYKKQELIATFDKFVAINYAEVYDTNRGVTLIPYPSGINVGSACWLLQKIMTHEKILWLNGISHHQWRACKQFHIPIKNTKINYLICASGTLKKCTTPGQDQIQCLQFLKMIFQRLNLSKGQNSKIVLNDFLAICDIINYIVFQFNDKFKHIFITGNSAIKLISYVNSFIEYLSPNHAKRIYQDPPAYPFQTFEDIKNKKISEGALQEICQIQKIPIKQLIMRSTPYLHFETDFYAYLNQQYEAVTVQKIFQPKINADSFQKWLRQNQIEETICFKKADQSFNFMQSILQNLRTVPLGLEWSSNSSITSKFYITQGQTINIVRKFTKKNGQLYIQQSPNYFRVLIDKWNIIITQGFKKYGINASYGPNYVQTDHSRVQLNNYKMKIESESQDELLLIQKLLQEITTIISLK